MCTPRKNSELLICARWGNEQISDRDLQNASLPVGNPLLSSVGGAPQPAATADALYEVIEVKEVLSGARAARAKLSTSHPRLRIAAVVPLYPSARPHGPSNQNQSAAEKYAKVPTIKDGAGTLYIAITDIESFLQSQLFLISAQPLHVNAFKLCIIYNYLLDTYKKISEEQIELPFGFLFVILKIYDTLGLKNEDTLDRLAGFLQDCFNTPIAEFGSDDAKKIDEQSNLLQSLVATTEKDFLGQLSQIMGWAQVEATDNFEKDKNSFFMKMLKDLCEADSEQKQMEFIVAKTRQAEENLIENSYIFTKKQLWIICHLLSRRHPGLSKRVDKIRTNIERVATLRVKFAIDDIKKIAKAKIGLQDILNRCGLVTICQGVESRYANNASNASAPAEGQQDDLGSIYKVPDPLVIIRSIEDILQRSAKEKILNDKNNAQEINAAVRELKQYQKRAKEIAHEITADDSFILVYQKFMDYSEELCSIEKSIAYKIDYLDEAIRKKCERKLLSEESNTKESKSNRRRTKKGREQKESPVTPTDTSPHGSSNSPIETPSTTPVPHTAAAARSATLTSSTPTDEAVNTVSTASQIPENQSHDDSSDWQITTHGSKNKSTNPLNSKITRRWHSGTSPNSKSNIEEHFERHGQSYQQESPNDKKRAIAAYAAEAISRAEDLITTHTFQGNEKRGLKPGLKKDVILASKYLVQSYQDPNVYHLRISTWETHIIVSCPQNKLKINQERNGTIWAEVISDITANECKIITCTMRDRDAQLQAAQSAATPALLT